MRRPNAESVGYVLGTVLAIVASGALLAMIVSGLMRMV
jgi:hypothetical protein